MRVIFDLDDTLCHTENRDYANAEPLARAVERLKAMRTAFPDAEVVIHTSRGMASCNGDVAKAEEKNRRTIEQWLSRYGIAVDGIIFGKPLADIYVDDKAMTAQDFSTAVFGEYEGFSGAKVRRFGKIIIKECKNASEQYRWYRKAAEVYGEDIYIPQVHSATLGKLYMEYVDGTPASECVDGELIRRMVGAMATVGGVGANDLTAYSDYVQGKARGIGLKTDIGERIERCGALRRQTFSHGDFSLLNVIIRENGRIALIDPSPKDFISTWLLDAAKLRSSILWLDATLAGVVHDSALVDILEDAVRECAGEEAVEAIRLLDETHLLRVWWYAVKLGRRKECKMMEHYYNEVYAKKV